MGVLGEARARLNFFRIRPDKPARGTRNQQLISLHPLHARKRKWVDARKPLEPRCLHRRSESEGLLLPRRCAKWTCVPLIRDRATASRACRGFDCPITNSPIAGSE